MDLLVPSFGLIFWTLLAFIIVFVILKKFAWKPILASLKERELGIAESLSTAERVRGEMASLKSENESLIAQAREERAKMINDAKEKAKREFERIVAEAQGAIQQQRNAALTDVKNQMGKLVIEVSEKVLRRELSNRNEQENYIKDLAESVKLN